MVIRNGTVNCNAFNTVSEQKRFKRTMYVLKWNENFILTATVYMYVLKHAIKQYQTNLTCLFLKIYYVGTSQA